MKKLKRFSILQSAAIALTAVCLVSSTLAADIKLELISKSKLDTNATYASLGLDGINKPSGHFYRLREFLDPGLPDKIPRSNGDLNLVIADPAGKDWFCLYRGAFNDDWINCSYKAALFSKSGKPRWVLPLNRFFPATRHLEVQDIRYVNGLIYYNEACQTYSSDAGGNCSALVCLDPEKQEILWRTAPLVSNNIFIFPTEKLIVCGYGFTNEPDSISILDAKTGEVLVKQPVDSAHGYFEFNNGRLTVITYKSVYVFNLTIPESFR